MALRGGISFLRPQQGFPVENTIEMANPIGGAGAGSAFISQPDPASYWENLQKYMRITSPPKRATATSGTTDSSQTGAFQTGVTAQNAQQSINELMSALTGRTQAVTTGAARTTGTGAQTGISETEIIGDETGTRFASALDRMAAERANVLQRFSAAERPLDEAAQMYAPGGTYGAGAKARIEEQFRGALQGARSNLAQSGMWSGSAMSGLNVGFEGEKFRQLQGVEDTRQQRLGDILASISGVRAGSGATLAAMRDPSYGASIGPYGTRTTTGGTSRTTQDQISRTQADSLTQQFQEQLGRTTTAGTSQQLTSGTTEQQEQSKFAQRAV